MREGLCQEDFLEEVPFEKDGLCRVGDGCAQMSPQDMLRECRRGQSSVA